MLIGNHQDFTPKAAKPGFLKNLFDRGKKSGKVKKNNKTITKVVKKAIGFEKETTTRETREAQPILSRKNLTKKNHQEEEKIKNLSQRTFGEKFESNPRKEKIVEGLIRGAGSHIRVISSAADLSKSEGPRSQDEKDKLRDLLRRDFFAKNLDSFHYIPDSIQGYAPIYAFSLLEKDLDSYRIDPTISPEAKRKATHFRIQLNKYKENIINLAILENKDTDQEIRNYLLSKLTVDISNKIADLKMRVSKEQKKNSYIMLGGTEDHLMIYEFIRTGTDKEGKSLFTFKIYNSGAGTQHHIHKGSKFRTYVKKNVTLESLVGRKGDKEECFIKQLIRISANYHEDNKTDQKYNVNAVYKLTESKLESKEKIKENNKKSKLVKSAKKPVWHKGQKQGSCAHKALSYFMRESYFKNDEEYWHFKKATTTHSIELLEKHGNFGKNGPRDSTKMTTSQKIARWWNTTLVKRFFSWCANRISDQSLVDLGRAAEKKRSKKYEKIRQARLKQER